MYPKFEMAFVLVLCLLLSACANQPAYKAAGDGRYGYKDSPLGKDRYRVSYVQRGKETTKTMDYALLRAAEVTLLEGYDWFTIVDRETLVDRKRVPSTQVSIAYGRGTVHGCGIFGCPYGTGVGVSTGVSGNEVEVILEIRLGKGVRPETGDSYDALETRDILQTGQVPGSSTAK